MDKRIKQFLSVPNFMRHRLGLTIAQLSEKTGVSPMSISRIENGILSVDVSQFLRLAEFYGITLDALLRNSFRDVFDRLDSLTAPLHTLCDKFSRITGVQRRNGITGEDWVYLQECKRLEGTPMANAVNPRYADDADAHFDILSFDSDGCPVVVEVKSTDKGPNAPFYLSDAELQTARDCVEARIRYELHRVFHVRDHRRISRDIIPGEELLRDYDILPKKYLVRRRVA